MKSILTLVTFAFFIFSCQSTTQPSTIKPSETDTAYAAWKAHRLLDSIRELSAPVVVAAPAVQTKTKTVYRTVSNKHSTASSTGNSNTAVTEAPKKKGWSKTAKGAVIGGVAGAVGGAVINKRNPAAGAVIGGVLGAGTGAVIGKVLDKKDKRN